jgi:hypothetical protein
MPIPPENPVVLPEDTNGAAARLDQLLVDPAPCTFLFIFGASAEINTFATLAVAASGGALRRVVRRSQYQDIVARFTNLQTAQGLPAVDSAGVVGFSTSGHLIVADVIVAGDTLNKARAIQSFIQADAPNV